MFVILLTVEFRCFSLASMQFFFYISICYFQFLCVVIDIVMNILTLGCLINCKTITIVDTSAYLSQIFWLPNRNYSVATPATLCGT